MAERMELPVDAPDPLAPRLAARLLDRRARLVEALTHHPAHAVEGLIGEVDEALARLRRGAHGVCERCHERMSAERLLADPLARVCLECLSEPEARALERDIAAASAIQRSLLPPRRMSAAGWDIAHRFLPAGPVSGDHVDVLLPAVAGGPLHVAIGDVSGKGLGASLLMSHLHAALRALSSVPQPLDELVSRANRLFCDSAAAGAFVTLVLARLTGDGDVELANAGHWPVLLVQGSRVDTIGSTGLPLGISPRAEHRVERLRLEPGDLLFAYTDGLTEATDARACDFGLSRLVEAVRELAPSPDEELLDGTLERVARFLGGASRHDDLTLMAVRRSAAVTQRRSA